MDVYREIYNTEKIPPPHPIKHKRGGGNRTEYCEYHQIYRHSTNECFDLKNVIERLAREGRLDWFLASKTERPRKRRREEEMERVERPHHTPKRHVHMINGGFARGGISKSSCKRHLKEVYHVGGGDRSADLPNITFFQDAVGIIPGHDDPMVITMILANANLHQTLVDQGSSSDILFKSAFNKLGLQDKELRAYPNSLFGLGDTPIQLLGYISLHTTFGKGTRSRTVNIDYIVVDVNSAYNAPIGQRTLNQLTTVVFTPHLCMKFPIPEGIDTIKGDQKIARRCYNESLNLKGDPKGEEINTIKLEGVQAREEL
ncbi:uncharacterized protein LOC107489219 [Arachis duranensis]|uniref:Uncharacterized protein LOC107489219 n=1 Tax=Arachis duranensis TaxID=130453 RepID=A0A6P4DJ37_ARADU|nr:uncharacterized protein LOC107489219 [Arachis duranensis]